MSTALVCLAVGYVLGIFAASVGVGVERAKNKVLVDALTDASSTLLEATTQLVNAYEPEPKRTEAQPIVLAGNWGTPQ